jgi:glucose/mannose transport system permease protein
MSVLSLSDGSRVDGPSRFDGNGKLLREWLTGLFLLFSGLAYFFDVPFVMSGISGTCIALVVGTMLVLILDIPFKAQRSKYYLTLASLALILWVFIAPLLLGSAQQQIIDAVFKIGTLALIFTVLTGMVWNGPFRNLMSKIASIPMMLIVLVGFVGSTIWTMAFSLTDAKFFPVWHLVGFNQYTFLMSNERWIKSLQNMTLYAICFVSISFVLGFLIAVMMDQKIRAEGVFRTIYLYPFALSFIVTGHVWAWIMNPAYGLEHSVRQMGWTSFNFDWLTNIKYSIYAVVIAGLWQGTGLVMALMLAGLRGIDDEVWKAAKIDGISKWRTYLQIILPMMRPVLITTLVIVASGAVRVFDLVLSLTQGGPGISSQVPAMYVLEKVFNGNLAGGLAASTIMLGMTSIVLIPWVYVEFIRGKQTR